jgi:hypothetical protein
MARRHDRQQLLCFRSAAFYPAKLCEIAISMTEMISLVAVFDARAASVVVVSDNGTLCVSLTVLLVACFHPFPCTIIIVLSLIGQ